MRAAAWALVKLSPHPWQRQQVDSVMTLASVPTPREPQNGQVAGFPDAAERCGGHADRERGAAPCEVAFLQGALVRADRRSGHAEVPELRKAVLEQCAPCGR